MSTGAVILEPVEQHYAFIIIISVISLFLSCVGGEEKVE
jgi:hypothetical protein